jgi:hypothetical protein
MSDEDFTARALHGLNPHYEPHWERMVGLVRGWDDSSQVWRYACTRCRVMVECTTREVPSEYRGVANDPITAKGWVPREELYVRGLFEKEAARVGCTHLQTRLAYGAQTAAHKAFDVLALRNLQREEKG